MNPQEEIATLRRRIGGVEFELEQLKLRLTALEAHSARSTAADGPTMASTTFEPQPLAATAAQDVSSAEPMPVESLATTELPPLLPVMPPPIATPQPSAEQPPVLPPPSPWRDWLEPLQLWPPSGEENAEVRLAAWWATRIGALLAVIGIVFLGVYVSRDSAPWVRLAEVMGVTAAVLGLGAWLERKLPKFGAVVFGAGLALAYFCAFAAYSVTPMKVIASPIVAMAGELLVVGGVLAVAWRRGSQVVATMAVALGHVTAFFAVREVPEGVGPWVVLLLGLVAVLLRIARGWGAPSVLALPVAWLFVLSGSVARADAATMELPVAWLWAVLFFVLYFLRDWIVAWRGGELSRLDRAFQVTNSTLAIAVGLFVTAQLGGSRLTQFYFGSGLVMLAATLAWQRVGAGATLAPIFVCKAAGLISLGVIAEFDGHARSLVLLVQAFVLLVSARQSSMRGLRTATIIVGAVALAFFASELRPENSALMANATLVEVVFLTGAIAFVGALQRWLALDVARTAFGSVVVGMAAIAAMLTWRTEGWGPALGVALGSMLFGVAATLRAWLPAAIAGAMLLVASHVLMWSFELPPFTRLELWLNELVLLGAAVGGAAGLARWRNDASKGRVHGALALLACGTLIAVGFKAFPATLALAVAAGVVLLLMVAAERAREWPLAALSVPLVALGLALFVLNGGRGNDAWLWLAAPFGWAVPGWLVASRARLETIRHAGWREWSPALLTLFATIVTLLALHENLRFEGRALATAAAALAVFALTWRPGLRPALEASWAIWLVELAYIQNLDASAATWLPFILSWAPAVALARPDRLGELSVPPPFWRTRAQGIQVTLATLLGGLIAVNLSGAERLAALGAVAATALAVWRWGRVAAARTAVFWVAAAGWVTAWLLASTPSAQGWGSGLAAVIAAGVAIALLPFAVERDVSSVARRRLRWSASVLALALIFHVFAVQRGAVADHATVGWGLAAVAMFLAGLFGRSRPHRLTGLAGLALCVPRAFLVDLDSTLHRIVAFVALGVVLLWVGFSYHRFRHLIVDEEKKL